MSPFLSYQGITRLSRYHVITEVYSVPALTASSLISSACIYYRIIDIVSYVAVEKAIAWQTLKVLSEGKIKGRKFRVRKLS